MGSDKLQLSLPMPHAEHEEHLCFLSNLGLFDLVKERVRNAEYVCSKCGRAASKAEYLCEPERIVPGGEHEEHLCYVQTMGLFDLLKERIQDPKYVCARCGRVASKAEYLCTPEEL